MQGGDHERSHDSGSGGHCTRSGCSASIPGSGSLPAGDTRRTRQASEVGPDDVLDDAEKKQLGEEGRSLEFKVKAESSL